MQNRYVFMNAILSSAHKAKIKFYWWVYHIKLSDLRHPFYYVMPDRRFVE